VYETAEEHGGLVKMYAPGRTIVAVSDPKVLAEVVAQEFDGVTKPEDLYKTLAVVGGQREVRYCWLSEYVYVL
jgi:pyoverdine/dityrosine biosynthesis protein Dit1